jgi:hypothetical protein
MTEPFGSVEDKLQEQVSELTKKLGMSVDEIVAEANQRSFERLYRDINYRELKELNDLLGEPNDNSNTI